MCLTLVTFDLEIIIRVTNEDGMKFQKYDHKSSVTTPRTARKTARCETFKRL
jgi:hypothetical protein